MKPLAIELFCGTFGWSAGWLAMGGRAIGFDLEHLPHHGPVPAGAELVLQDVLSLNGAQFKDAAVIFASPPCQKYSYLAMPWSKSTDPNNSKAAKALRKEWETNGPDNRLFDACFRIQREAIEATGETCPECGGTGVYEERLADCDKRDWPCEKCDGIGAINTRHIPLIVENVRGAQPWVGRAKANYGSFYLFGDVAQVGNRIQMGPDIGRFGAGLRARGSKGHGGSWFFRTGDDTGGDPRDVRRDADGNYVMPTKQPNGDGDWFSKEARDAGSSAKYGSRSAARKAASAQIAKIPYALSEYAAQALWPAAIEAAA